MLAFRGLVAPRERLRTFWAASLYMLIAWFWLGDAVLGSAAVIPESFIEHARPFRAAVQTDLPEQSFSDVTPVISDYPLGMLFARGLVAGRLDLWNPWSGCGMPLWAEQGGPFFPLYLPFYLSPQRATFNLALILKVVAFALGGFVLARKLGLPFLFALVVGALLELSGMTPSLLSFASPMALALVPWAVWAGLSVAQPQRSFDVAAATLVVALAFHSGHPASIALAALAFVCGLLGGGAAAVRSLRPKRVAARLAFVVGVGLSLAAPKLLPTAELIAHGSTYKTTKKGRSSFESDAKVSRKSLPVAIYAASAYPELRRQAFALWPWHAGSAQALFVFLLALVGLSWRRPWAVVFLAASGVWLLTAGFEREAYLDVPGATFLLPRYCGVLLQVATCVLAGFGLQALARPRASMRLALACGPVVLGAKISLAMTLYKYSDLSQEVILEAGEATMRWTLGLAGLLMVLAAAPLGRLGLSRGQLVVPAAALIALVQAALTFGPAAKTASSPLLEHPPPIVPALAAETDRQWRLHAPSFYLLAPNLAGLYGIRDVRASAALAPWRLHRFLSLAPQFDASWTELSIRRTDLPHLDLMSARVLALRGTQHRRRSPVLTAAPRTPSEFIMEAPRRGRPRADSGPQVLFAQPDGPHQTVVVARSTAVPRARLLFETMIAEDAEDAEGMVAAALPRGNVALGETPLGQGVVLEPASDRTRPEALSGRGHGRATIRATADPDEVVIQTVADRRAYLVLSDTYYPGWSVTVDGQPAPLHPANLAFRAVKVPAGEHEVRFVYRPASFRWGLLLFGMGLLGLTMGWRKRV